MNKLLLVISILSLGLKCINAQVFDLNTKWYYCIHEWPNKPGQCLIREFKNTKISNDTILSEFSFGVINGGTQQQLKQKGNKVWLNNELIYDFDLNIGDTLKLKSHNEIFNFILDSIQVKETFGKMRKHQLLSNKSSFNKIVIIEGIGMVQNYPEVGYQIEYGGIYLTFGELRVVQVVDPPPILSIVEIGNERTIIKLIAECKFCEDLVYSSKNEHDKYEIFPNPSSSYLQFDATLLSHTNNFEIFDQFGKLVYETSLINNTDKIYIGDLKNGVYFIKISANENSKSQMKRFIKI